MDASTATGALAPEAVGRALLDVLQRLLDSMAQVLRWIAGRPGYPVDEGGASFLLVAGFAAMAAVGLYIFTEGGLRTSAAGDRQGPPLRVRTEFRAVPRGGTRSPSYRSDGRAAFEQGRAAARRTRPRDVDGILDRFVQDGLGDPRILRHHAHLFVVRVDGCRGCAPTGPEGGPGTGCPFETGFLEGGFQVLLGEQVSVREAACGMDGQERCEFEVWL